MNLIGGVCARQKLLHLSPCVCVHIHVKKNTLGTTTTHQKRTPPKIEVNYKTSSLFPCFPPYELTSRILPRLLLLLLHLLLLLLLLSFYCGW